MRALGLRLAGVFSVGALLFGGGLAVGVASAGAVPLPDGRVYELVSPTGPGQEANVFVSASSYSTLSPFGEHGVLARRPFIVTPDGKAVVYAGEPPPTGGDGYYGVSEGNEFMARRSTGGGWTATDIQLPGKGVKYVAFSSDFSVGIFSSEQPLTADSPRGGFYSYATAGGGGGEGQPLYAGTRHELNHVVFGGVPLGGPLYAGGNSGTSAAPEFSHLLLEANAALTPEAVDGGEKEDNLYDSVGGRLYPVNVLPDGEARPNAVFGSFPTYLDNGNSPAGLSHVVSADGSRIFWTALEAVEVEGEVKELPAALYVREDARSSGARTVQVDGAVGGGGVFLTASTDGSKVFFTKGDLYRYDVDSGQTLDLTPGVSVLGVVGASDDGEYVYYTDSNYRLNLWHGGVSTPIATLSPEDGGVVDPGVFPFERGGGSGQAGDWQAAVGYHTAEVTPDGHSLVFMSNRSLTGYDNEEKGERLFEVFVYEAGAGRLTCVSCNPTGEAPVPTELDAYLPRGLGAFIPISKSAGDEPRVISADGARVFFNSGEPLVPQDNNGWLDVYEWEREGTASCREAQGCVYLLSGGTDPENSYLIGTSTSGDDAFMISRAQLVAQDRGGDDAVYDARVGGVQPVAAPSCSGSGCQGVPPAPPIFATPSSVTFSGVGNFPPPASGGAKPKPRALTMAQKLTRALKSCHAKRDARGRRACEVGARKRYGSKSRAAKSRAKSNGRGK